MMLYDFVKQELVENRKTCWKVLRKVTVCLFLLGMLSQFLSFHMAPVCSQPSSLLVFAEASSFARLDDIDPSGWFYQAVLYNPTDSDIAVTGLRWWYNASAKIVDGSRDAKCYDSRYFSSLPSTYNPNDRTIRWEYAAGTISLTVPTKGIVVTWIEVPTDSVNNDAILATYYVQAYVDGQWLSSPLYVSHSGHDKITSTVFRADFDLTTDPGSENHTHSNPEWLFNEDRSVIANLSTRVRVIPITASRNTNGIDYATVNMTLPSGWSYVSGSASNPYNEIITPYSVGGKDRLKWDLSKDVLRYSTNQSIAQNYMEFNITAPHIPGIHNFTVTSAVTSLAELRTTIENQFIYAVVKTHPNATFAYSPTAPLTGESATFNATASYDLDGQILSYLWDFGDGNTGTGNITTHSYVDNGTYTITLTVTDNDGLNDTALDTILVQNRPPVAQFTESAEIVDTNVVIHFNASDSYDLDGSIVSYLWDFDEGTNATGMTATHSYSNNGTYVVTLTVTDDDGATASANAIKTVLNRPPVANFTESAETVYTNDLITFNATNSYDSDGSVVSYFWDFGDGTNTTGMVVDHAYLDNGNYTVTLSVTDNDGATASVNATKTVLNRSPVASFTESATTVYAGETIYFNASGSYDPDGSIVSYFWDFGDETNGTGEITTHSYAENGTYTVILDVTDDDGLSDIVSANIMVSIHDVALVSVTPSATKVHLGKVVNFTVVVRNEGTATESFVVTLYYNNTLIETQNVTDLAPNTETTLEFSWYTAGVEADVSYVIKAEAGVVTGETDTVDNNIYIDGAVKVLVPEAPLATFTYSPIAPIVGDPVTFNASSSFDPDGTIANYAWDFGDGSLGNGMIVTHTYETAGSYNVTLTITDDSGLKDTSTSLLTAFVHDIAIISVTPTATNVEAGRIVDITVVVKNEGNANETFNVIVYCGGTEVGSRTVDDLAPGEERTLNFSWSTSGITSSASYKIRAEATALSSETDTTDNTYIDGEVKVSSQPTSSLTIPFPYFIPIILSVVGSSVIGLLWKKQRLATPKTLPPKELGIFDALASETIPDSYSVMIVGDAGSGKSVLCQQLVDTYLKQGKPCIYVTYDCFPNEVRENMKALGWDTSEYEQNETFLFVDCYSSIAGVPSQEKHFVKQPFALSELSIAISTAMEDLKQKSVRVFLDSTVPLFTRLDSAKVAEFLQDRSAQIKGENGVFFFAIGKGTVEQGLMRRLEEIVDCVIELDIHDKAVETERRMRVKKLRGRRFIQEWVSFKIEQRKGFALLNPKKWIKKKKMNQK